MDTTKWLYIERDVYNISFQKIFCVLHAWTARVIECTIHANSILNCAFGNPSFSFLFLFFQYHLSITQTSPKHHRNIIWTSYKHHLNIIQTSPEHPHLKKAIKYALQSFYDSEGTVDIGKHLPTILTDLGMTTVSQRPMNKLATPSSLEWQWPRTFLGHPWLCFYLGAIADWDHGSSLWSLLKLEGPNPRFHSRSLEFCSNRTFHRKYYWDHRSFPSHLTMTTMKRCFALL